MWRMKIISGASNEFDEYRLEDDYSIKAGSKLHWYMMITSSVSVIAFVIGIPAFLLYLASRSWVITKSSLLLLKEDKPSIATEWSQKASILGSIIESYKPRYW
jgi:hypothetical protein